MGLFKRKKPSMRGLEGASAQDAIMAAMFGAEEREMPFGETMATMMRSFLSVQARDGQALFSIEAIVAREMRDWEAQPALVLAEAMRLALQRNDSQAFEEICNAGAIMMTRWQRRLMAKGLMPEKDRWGEFRES